MKRRSLRGFSDGSITTSDSADRSISTTRWRVGDFAAGAFAKTSPETLPRVRSALGFRAAALGFSPALALFPELPRTLLRPSNASNSSPSSNYPYDGSLSTGFSLGGGGVLGLTNGGISGSVILGATVFFDLTHSPRSAIELHTNLKFRHVVKIITH